MLKAIPLLLTFIVVFGFVAVNMLATHLLGPKRKSEIKDNVFECGIEAVGNARARFSVRYFLVSILFVLFDVELVFLYPWALNFRALGWAGFLEMLLFVGLFVVGLIYIIKNDVLAFERD